MLLPTLIAIFSITGLLAKIRGLQLFAGTASGTIARFEAERAEGLGTLLIILSAPWLIAGSIWAICAG